jgi:Leucine-rich repeat (LRR) protein
LESIDFSYNSLNELPNQFGALTTSLKSLKLCHNIFENFPMSVLSLQSLTALFMSFNFLHSVPLLTSLRSLNEIDLGDNRLDKAPEGISLLPNLHFLSVENNNLKKIPLEWAKSKSLMTLMINGNPQRQISNLIIQKGTPAIISYLQMKLGAEEDGEFMQSTPNVKLNEQIDTSTRNKIISDKENARNSNRSESSNISNNNNNSKALNSIPQISEPSEHNTGVRTVDDNITKSSTPLRSQPSRSPAASPKASIHEAMLKLRENIASMTNELENNFALSTSAQHALKKKLALERANLLRLERNEMN